MQPSMTTIVTPAEVPPWRMRCGAVGGWRWPLQDQQRGELWYLTAGIVVSTLYGYSSPTSRCRRHACVIPVHRGCWLPDGGRELVSG